MKAKYILRGLGLGKFEVNTLRVGNKYTYKDTMKCPITLIQ